MMKSFIYYILLLYLLPIFILGQNEVCFDIEPNPFPNNPALTTFTKYINVLGCIDIFAENQISDDKILEIKKILLMDLLIV